jgi:hypothetical protein
VRAFIEFQIKKLYFFCQHKFFHVGLLYSFFAQKIEEIEEVYDNGKAFYEMTLNILRLFYDDTLHLLDGVISCDLIKRNDKTFQFTPSLPLNVSLDSLSKTYLCLPKATKQISWFKNKIQ